MYPQENKKPDHIKNTTNKKTILNIKSIKF